MKWITFFILLATVKSVASESGFDVDDFEGMMGKFTPYWRHVIESEDVSGSGRNPVSKK